MSTQTRKRLTDIRSDFERGVFLSVYISGGILVRGVREDYADHVEGFILRQGYPGRLLFPGIFIS